MGDYDVFRRYELNGQVPTYEKRGNKIFWVPPIALQEYAILIQLGWAAIALWKVPRSHEAAYAMFTK